MIFVTGDIHGDCFSRLKTASFPEQKEMTRNDTVIILGDFGLVWAQEETKEEAYKLDWLSARSFTTVFVDGNHENYDRLKSYPIIEWNGGKVQELRPHVYHLMRGEVYTIENRRFFAFGGASSHDISDGIVPFENWKKTAKQWQDSGKYMFRIDHVSWWADELPTQKEMFNGEQNLEQHDWNVDFVLSHCAPTYIVVLMGFDGSDRLTEYFQHLVYDHALQFRHWLFGHYHVNRKIDDRFVCLYEQITRIV